MLTVKHDMGRKLFFHQQRFRLVCAANNPNWVRGNLFPKASPPVPTLLPIYLALTAHISTPNL